LSTFSNVTIIDHHVVANVHGVAFPPFEVVGTTPI